MITGSIYLCIRTGKVESSLAVFRRVAPTMIGDVGINAHHRVRIKIEEGIEINGDFQFVLIVAACLVGLCRRDARQIVLSVFPAVFPLVCVVGSAVDAPIAWPHRFVCRFPQMAVAQGSHLLTDRNVSPVRTTTVYLHRIYFLRVVGHAPVEHQRVGVAQSHGSQVGCVVLARKPLQFSVAIDFVHESWLDGHVKHVLLLAVSYARLLLEVAFLVVGLDVFDCLHRQQVRQHGLAERFLSVHHQFQRFAVPQQFAVVDTHARQLLYQLYQPCAVLRLESLGVEHHGVAPHVEAAHAAFHRHLAQQVLVHP